MSISMNTSSYTSSGSRKQRTLVMSGSLQPRVNFVSSMEWTQEGRFSSSTAAEEEEKKSNTGGKEQKAH